MQIKSIFESILHAIQQPELTAIPNMDSWDKVSSYLDKHHKASLESHTAVAAEHDYPAGGAGLIKYCIKNGWLVEVDDYSVELHLIFSQNRRFFKFTWSGR